MAGDPVTNGKELTLVSGTTLRPANARRRLSGTTLVEVLVVMVVFLVGILAVVQIFPKGFQILLLSRNASVATALSRDEVQRLKSRPDGIPEAILAIDSEGNIDSASNPFDLGPLGDSLSKDGILSLAGSPQGDWPRFTGPNRFRRVIGENHQLSAPRQTGEPGSRMYGSLVLAEFNPVDSTSPAPLRFYGNDLNVTEGAWDDQTPFDNYDAFVSGTGANTTLQLPTGPLPWAYRISFTGTVTTGRGGSFQRRDFVGLSWLAPGNLPAPSYPLASVQLSSLVSGVGALVQVDTKSIRVQREFRTISAGNDWSVEDPYELKILSHELGAFLFHPMAFTSKVSRGSTNEPLQVRMDYTIFDWRVIREEFRFPYLLPAEHQLAIGNLPSANVLGSDGRTANQGIAVLEGDLAPNLLFRANNYRADHFVLQDVDTGGLYVEQAPGAPTTSNNPVIRVDKSTGVVSVRDTDDDLSNGTTVPLLLLDGTVTTVQLDGRAVRALYMTRNNYAVQVIKSPSLYTVAYARPEAGQFYIGNTGSIGGGTTRVYFPRADAGRKVTVGELSYRRAGDIAPRQLFGQDFVVRAGSVSDPVGLPYIDITEADPDAAFIDVATDARSNGIGVRNVKSASLAVRTVWNPDAFTLGDDPADNLRRLERWLQSTRKSTIETYLEQGSLAQ